MHPVAPPLYLSAPFASDDPAGFVATASKVRPSGFYTRYGNPGTAEVEQRLAALEGGEAAIMFSSGMAAMAALVLDTCDAGAHVIAQRQCYGGTRALLDTLARKFAISVTWVDQTDPASFRDAWRPETRLVLLESPSNPLLLLTDLSAVGASMKGRDVVVALDSTIASPVNQASLALGVDVVMHSATKYLAGHADATAGVLVSTAARIDRIWKLAILLGSQASPMDAWLVGRGLRTLELRMKACNAAGRKLAAWLEEQPWAAAVHYPGMHGDAGLFQAQMRGGGGLVSFEFAGTAEQADDFLDHLGSVQYSASFGSFGTLATRPAAMWSGIADPLRLEDSKVPANLIRIGLGLGDVDALIADMSEAGVKTRRSRSPQAATAAP